MLGEAASRSSGPPLLTKPTLSEAGMATKLLYRLGCASKVCSKCGEAKPRTEFNRDKGKERAYCKACHSLETRKWVTKNKDRRNAYISEWYQKNKDKYSEYA